MLNDYTLIYSVTLSTVVQSDPCVLLFCVLMTSVMFGEYCGCHSYADDVKSYCVIVDSNNLEMARHQNWSVTW